MHKQYDIEHYKAQEIKKLLEKRPDWTLQTTVDFNVKLYTRMEAIVAMITDAVNELDERIKKLEAKPKTVREALSNVNKLLDADKQTT